MPNKYQFSTFSPMVSLKQFLVAGLIFILGAGLSKAGNVSLTTSDIGGTSSFNSIGNWNNSAAPTAANNYFTSAFVLRSPANSTSYAFAGSSLSIDTGGRFLMKGTRGQIMTVTNLILNGGLADMANSSDNFVETLAGGITLNAGKTSYLGALSVSGGAETLIVTAPITGSGNLQIAGSNVNGGGDNGTVIFSGTNSYTGNTTIAGGTLQVNAPLSNANIIVASGGTLGGTGVIAPRAGGQISVLTNGVLSPGGTSIGTLVVDGSSASGSVLSFASGAQLSFQLNNGLPRDVLCLSNGAAGDILFTNSTITFTDLSGNTLSNGLYTLFTADAANAYSGLALDGSNYVMTGLTIGLGLGHYPSSRLRVVNNDIDLEITSNMPLFTVTFPLAVTNNLGISLVVGSNGIYSVNFASPAWTFTGNLAQGLTNRVINSGTDNIDAYSEIDFNYTSAVPHSAGIRLYNNSPVVTFNDTTLAAGANDLAFPNWVSYPAVQNHITYGADAFGEYDFVNFYDGSPWLFFNANYDTFFISPAANYEVASIVKNGLSISCGINVAITQLPAGFTNRVILTAQNGINQCYTTWGNALLALAGKTMPANDACLELNKLGYWTDNGAAYYYNTNAPLGIQTTLFNIRDEFASKGVPLSHVQVDSWWYPKGVADTWQGDASNNRGGINTYTADPTLFPAGLASFQQQLGLPLITHSRWIDSSSPYVGLYTMSASVITDSRYWTNRMAYLKSSGVVTYEQDWISASGTPAMNLTNGGAAYLGNMQAAAATNGINLQYCMPRGRDFLQGSLYTNLMTIRVSFDAFGSPRWQEFIYDSRLAQAVGVWPWCDEFRSTETRNLLISTLSAGPVGTGDALGTVSAANLSKSVRPDGVIVKPDVPLVPTDSTYVNDALGLSGPFIATSYTDNTNSRACYVFAFGESSANLSGSFTPASFGITNNAYVYDYFNATGTVVSAGGTFNFTTVMPDNTSGGSYFVVVPVGPSGIAFLGDTNKFVTRGKKRISYFSDNGFLRVTVAFAAGETNVALSGYAPSNPYVFSLGSTTNSLTYNATTHLFTLNLTPAASGTATLGVSLAPVPSIQITPGTAGQFQISWPLAAAGYSLQKATDLTPPVVWSQTSNAVISSNGQNVVTITNADSTVFYRLTSP
jgi:autotransporter-associated beta strand protein